MKMRWVQDGNDSEVVRVDSGEGNPTITITMCDTPKLHPDIMKSKGGVIKNK